MRIGWAPFVVTLIAMLIVPVGVLSYNVWFFSNFGSLAKPLPQAPAGYATVLMLQQDSTARIYENFSSYDGGFMSEGNAYRVGSYSPSSPVTVQADRVWLPWSGNIVEVFTVSTSTDAHGFFMLWITGLCPGLPLAVGMSASQVNASDFFGLGGVYLCIGVLSPPHTLSYSGFEVIFVKLTETYWINEPGL